MIKLFGQDDPKIAKYAAEVFQPEDDLLLLVRKRAKALDIPDIHVGKMDGLHLQVLTRAFSAKNAVEIGTLVGYSGINICRGLASNGHLYTFEMNPTHAKVAEENFKMAGFENMAEIYLGPALEELKKIEDKGPFDLVFIDADKQNYSNYLDWAQNNLKIGGVLLADNTFAWGLIADKTTADKNVIALDLFNRKLATNQVFQSTILPTGEGLTLAVRVK